jgi:hypothetical protein
MPIYRVYVVDRNHVGVHYYRSRSTAEYEIFERTEGEWHGGRIILIGPNPAG